MKVLITSGGTREHIDEIRVLTNISTGFLGSRIANAFYFGKNIEKIYYICSSGTALPIENPEVIEVICANSAQEVFDAMEKLVPNVDVVIHSMAISDFGFKPSNIKLKSNDPQAFIESLRDRIIVNPKVISFIKQWNPNVILVGFKFEVGKTNEELIDIAYESLIKNNCDYVIANDKAEMKEKNEHVAYIIDKNKVFEQCWGKVDIAKKILTKIIYKK